jgi:hypothetical protein
VSVYRPTVEEFNWVEYDLGLDQLLMLQVIDTSGSHDFLAMRHLYAKTGDAFLASHYYRPPPSGQLGQA